MNNLYPSKQPDAVRAYAREWARRSGAKRRENNEARRQAARLAALAEWLIEGYRLGTPDELELRYHQGEPVNVVVVEIGPYWGVADLMGMRLWVTALRKLEHQHEQPTWAKLLENLENAR